MDRITSLQGFNWNAWVDLPFEERGRGPASYDCWGLVRAVLREAKGIMLPEFLDYTSTDFGGDATEAMMKHKHELSWPSVPSCDVQPFDVVVFQNSNDGGHVGIVVRKGRFLHVSRGSVSRFDRYTGFHWRNRIEGFYRYENIL